MEDGLAIAAAGASHEDSIQKHGMKVRMKFEVGGSSLHDGHGAAATSSSPLDFHAAAIPTQNRIDEDSRHRAEEGTVIRQSRAQGVGHCENELSQADFWVRRGPEGSTW